MTGPLTKALVVEGGAMRGVFSTGVLDGFLEAGFNPFDLSIGVSSGASNLAAYLAGMHGRNAKIYLDYSLRPEFLSYRRFILGGHLLDLDWMWETTIREIRLDLEAIYSRRRPFIAVLTDVMTGSAFYRFTGASDLEQTLKASSAMPLVYRGFPPCGRPSFHGRRACRPASGKGGHRTGRGQDHGHPLAGQRIQEEKQPLRQARFKACAGLSPADGNNQEEGGNI
ncbi:MAG: patatin-like phospholipase family protein [Syntrophaceae bacterium]